MVVFVSDAKRESLTTEDQLRREVATFNEPRIFQKGDNKAADGFVSLVKSLRLLLLLRLARQTSH